MAFFECYRACNAMPECQRPHDDVKICWINILNKKKKKRVKEPICVTDSDILHCHQMFYPSFKLEKNSALITAQHDHFHLSSWSTRLPFYLLLETDVSGSNAYLSIINSTEHAELDGRKNNRSHTIWLDMSTMYLNKDKNEKCL